MRKVVHMASNIGSIWMKRWQYFAFKHVRFLFNSYHYGTIMASHVDMIVRPPAWENCLALEPKSDCVLGRWGLRGIVEWLGKWNWLELPTNGGIKYQEKDVCQQRLTFFIFFPLEVKLESFGKSESRGAHRSLVEPSLTPVTLRQPDHIIRTHRSSDRSCESRCHK